MLHGPADLGQVIISEQVEPNWLQTVVAYTVGCICTHLSQQP